MLLVVVIRCDRSVTCVACIPFVSIKVNADIVTHSELGIACSSQAIYTPLPFVYVDPLQRPIKQPPLTEMVWAGCLQGVEELLHNLQHTHCFVFPLVAL